MPEKPTYEELEQRLFEFEKAESERRQADEERTFKAMLLEAVSEASTDGILVVADNGRILYSNNRFGEIWKIPDAVLKTKDDKKLLKHVWVQLKNPDDFSRKVAWLYQHPDEKSRDEIAFVDGRCFDRYSSPLKSADGKHYSRIWYFSDITERKLAQQALLDSENQFRAAFQGSPVALAITTQENAVWVDVNQAEIDMFGYTREELIGKSAMTLNLWADPDDRQKFVDVLEQCGEVKNQIACLCCKDGRVILGAVSANSLTLKGVKHILFATEDITERNQSEERLRQNLIEKEILLREIHHRVKNNLAVVSGLLGLQANRISENGVKEIIKACQQRIRSMALVHEKMYSAQNLSCVKFSEYIGSLVQELTASFYREKRNIITRITPQDILLNIEIATPCGLIINELITNAVKHAFPEKNNPLLYIGFEKTDKTYTLTVEDNGIGMPHGFEASATNTMGILLVRALTRQLRGTVNFYSDAAVRQGTTVVVSFTEK